MSHSLRMTVLLILTMLLMSGLLLSGCQLLQPQDEGSGLDTGEIEGAATPTSTEQVASDIPVAQATMEATPVATEPAAETEPPAETETAAEAISELITVTLEAPLLPTPTPTVVDTGLLVTALSVNVRSGPGTEYDVIAIVSVDEEYGVVGKTEAGDWWQACCFDGELGWFFAPLVEVAEPDSVPVVVDIPLAPLPTATPEQAEQPEAPQVEPVQEEPILEEPTLQEPAQEAPAQDEPAQEEPSVPEPDAQNAAPQEQGVDAAAPGATANAGTQGVFDPAAQYHIVDYRVLGFEDNNGGIFNKGGQQLIFVTVLDENGNGVNGAVVKDAVGDKLNVPVGSKGPGKAEIKMDWDPYKLYVAADPSGPVTSQISNQMNNPYPHIPDVIGKLGPADNEYAICPTADDRCEPPFYHAHWSYAITFQKVN